MGDAERLDLNVLAAKLAPSEIEEVADFIAWKVAKHEGLARAALDWHASLPAEDEEIAPEEDVAVTEAMTEQGAIPWEQVKAELGL